MTRIIILPDTEMDMMAPQAASKMPNDHGIKKASGRMAKKARKGKDPITAVSEYSLAGFLDDEPDLYSVADIKVRYR